MMAMIATLGCEGSIDDPPGEPPEWERDPVEREFRPAVPTLRRLTRVEYEQTIRQLFPADVVVPSDLPTDTILYGFSTVGGSELTLPPLEVEQYEASARALAEQVIVTRAARDVFFECDVAEASCFDAFLLRFGARAWRRPLTRDEVTSLASIARDVGGLLGDPYRGAGYAIAAILQSPHFLFRVALGEPDPEDESLLRYTSVEMATRLSYLLWGSGPDEELSRAGAAGELVTDAGLITQSERMLADPRARETMLRFWEEFVQLDRLVSAGKDPDLFPSFTPSLRASMHQEVVALFADVYDRDVDVRTVFSTHRASVDAELAAHYGLPAPTAPRQTVTLPPEAERGGLMGRAAVLAMWAHATENSPTFRGKYIRTNLLCQEIPPPPPGVVTELPEATGTETLRQRLDRHRTDPSCNSCHVLMDPLGFPLEHFDPVGKRRELDEGMPIDATGDVDGVAVDGAQELGDALASSERVGACFARRFIRFGVGHLESRAESVEVGRIATAFASSGYRMQALIQELVLSPMFRKAAYPESGCAEGDTNDCSNACGEGLQRCEGGAFTACSAPTAETETCNGRDDDCDGHIDEEITRACSGECGPGIETCVAGSFGACSARDRGTEECGGATAHVDDDCDGRVDEGFGPQVVNSTYTNARTYHPRCDGSTERIGLDCNEAFHAFCSTAPETCGTSGFGPLENSGDVAIVACVEAEVLVTSYAELAVFHPDCASTGLPCNSAIQRFCNDAGFPTGYGPVRENGAEVTVACVPGSVAVETTYTELAMNHPGCTTSAPIGPTCNAAINRFCRARGAVTGFGPVESSGNTAVVGCVR